MPTINLAKYRSFKDQLEQDNKIVKLVVTMGGSLLICGCNPSLSTEAQNSGRYSLEDFAANCGVCHLYPGI
jgi:hypothetical protein